MINIDCIDKTIEMFCERIQNNINDIDYSKNYDAEKMTLALAQLLTARASLTRDRLKY